jgi:hypothetical protein
MGLQEQYEQETGKNYFTDNYIHEEGSFTDSYVEWLENKIESFPNTDKCNIKKADSIGKAYLFLHQKDGLIDVWLEGECLGKNLNTEEINKLEL